MESISRISSLLGTARDLTLEAARDVGPRKPSRPLPPQQIKKLLDSRNEREVLDGLRRVIAMQYANPPQPTLTFFPSVLKTLSHPYPSTRPLVYNYLIHHAEADPDTALLAINTIQKSLSDASPRVRAMALKTMSGIRVPVISQIVSLAIKKGVSDLSPIVRKAAALACVKCVRLDPGARPQVEEYLATLLLDKQYYVAGAAVQAFMAVCPARLDFIHPTYRKLCRMVVDMDEWGQLATLRLLTIYARRCFPRRMKRQKRAATQEERAKDFYEDLEPKEEDESEYEHVDLIDPDLDLFLKSILPLLQSRNSAVIVAVARAYLYLSPTNYLHHAIGPLIALLRSPQDIQEIALYDIVQVCLTNPTLFLPYFRHFLIRSTEAPQIWRMKLEVLTLIFPDSDQDVQDLILAELEHFSKGHDSALVRESVRAIGRCAQSSSATTAKRCMTLLLRQIRSPDPHLVGESIDVIRLLIQRSPDEHKKTVVRLAKNLDTLTSPTARASIIWLIGEFAGVDPENNIAADVLRLLVKGYADEDDEVRAQIVLLAAKVYLHYLNEKNAKLKALDALNGHSSSNEADTPTAPLQQHANAFASSAAGQQDDEGEGEGFRENVFAPHGSFEPPPPPSGDQDPQPKPQQGEKRQDTIELLYRHTMLLARYTPSYDLRDRARLFRALLAVPSSTDLASLLLLAPKPVPQAPSPSESRRAFALGSASLVVGEEAGIGGLRGYEPIPDWVEAGREPEAKLRDDPEGIRVEYAPTKAMSAGQKLDEALGEDVRTGKGDGVGRKGKTLDDWLDEEDDEDEEEEEDGSGVDEDGEDLESEEETDQEEEEESEDETESEEEEDEKAGLVR